MGEGAFIRLQVKSSSLAIEKIINMAAAFVGKFKLASQENFDEYMKAIGVGMAKRAMARAATPVVTYSLNGDEITIGVECDEETLDGRKTKSVFQVQGDKLVKKESWDGKTATLTYELDSNGLVVTICLGDITCVRK